MRQDPPSPTMIDGVGVPLCVLVWEAEGPAPPGAPTTLLILHGYLDCAGTFAGFVRHLPRWLRVVAPDLRGHGRSGRVHQGSWYHFEDYVRDVRVVMDALAPGPLAVLGHSMGGGIASLVAGAWPDKVARLVLVEGLGPPREDLADGPARLARWVHEVSDGPRAAAAFADLDEVAARLRRQNPAINGADSRELAAWLAEVTPDGARWRHDPFHRARTPSIYQPERYAPFLAAITAPTLFVAGETTWYRWDDLPDRQARVARRRAVCLPGIGHMIHYEAPALLASTVAAFLIDSVET